jgi:hypothetical protein
MPRFPLGRIAAPLYRPSPDECAEDFAWFRERLADPDVLDCAVGVKVDGAVLLAVPVGGSRHGGYLSVGTVTDAVRVWAALRGLPGFPRVRIRLSVYRDTCHTVDWGCRQPWGDAERGRHFGYTPSAIAIFLRRLPAPFDPAPRAAEEVPDQERGRSSQHDPRKSTLRDIGGCLSVILMGVLLTLLVSAAKADAANSASVLRSPSAPRAALQDGAASPTSLTSPRWAAR